NGVNSLKLSAAMHSNNRDVWILFQNNTNDSVFALLVNPNGLALQVETKINQPLFDYSRLKVSPNSEMFAVLGALGVQMFDFNRTTGVPSHKYSLVSPDSNYLHYCFAFSADNSRLYTGTAASITLPLNTTVFQYDLTAGNAAQVDASRNIIYNTTTYGAVADMQLAMDGKIYLTFGYEANSLPWNPINSPYLSVINCPDF